MPITNREQAKESGFAQVREAMIAFEGDVVRAEFGQWGGALIDEDGKKLPVREFLEVENTNVKVLEVSEELAFMPDDWNFRINCSEFKGSFWIENFLLSADNAKLLIPDDLAGKRILWRKANQTYNIKGKEVVASNFVIDKVLGAAAMVEPTIVLPGAVAPIASAPAVTPSVEDPMAMALELAVGKTEAQFRSAITLAPEFKGNPLLPLAKAGAITAALVKEGKLVEVQDGNKVIYQKV